MSGDGNLLLRNVVWDAQPARDLLIRDGRIAAIGPRLSGDVPALDGRGALLIPGLHDAHIHLLASAAALRSVAVDPAAAPDRERFETLLRDAATSASDWIRATGYHDSTAGPLTRDTLDRIVVDRPLRVQQRTGSLWILNSAGLARVLGDAPPPSEVECDEHGRPTGRIWRGDAWLRSRLPTDPPPLAEIGTQLARWGVTHVTDTSATTGPAEARLLADAVRTHALPQHVTLMSAGPLEAPVDNAYAVGPVKILLDEHDLPAFDVMVGRIRAARSWQRRVAVHCATAAELAFALAAFDVAGSETGDRIEHGSVIPEAAIAEIVRLELTVVTQPGFLFERGDRYRHEVAEEEHDSLYRVASLRAAGIAVALSTDAPYTDGNPWRAMRSAVNRRSRSGFIFGPNDRITPATALELFLSTPDQLNVARRIAVGASADLCLLTSFDGLDPDPSVAATIIKGRVAYCLMPRT